MNLQVTPHQHLSEEPLQEKSCSVTEQVQKRGSKHGAPGPFPNAGGLSNYLLPVLFWGVPYHDSNTIYPKTLF